eukprot:TRINITY_DN746_c0_g1_i1.p1 TRINITY_DN746_c0_g1~~TRINITY_DN746_c0_g1_i1.p1  ORF type:complete len:353 (-),score=66.55 TRINITY_DN746_c0_g1_i1:139-1197(-)
MQKPKEYTTFSELCNGFKVNVGNTSGEGEHPLKLSNFHSIDNSEDQFNSTLHTTLLHQQKSYSSTPSLFSIKQPMKNSLVTTTNEERRGRNNFSVFLNDSGVVERRPKVISSERRTSSFSPDVFATATTINLDKGKSKKRVSQSQRASSHFKNFKAIVNKAPSKFKTKDRVLDSTLQQGYCLVQALHLEISLAKKENDALKDEYLKVEREIKDEYELRRAKEKELTQYKGHKKVREEELQILIGQGRLLEEKVRQQHESVEKERAKLCEEIKRLLKKQQALLSSLCESKLHFSKEDERMRAEIGLHKMLIEELNLKRDQMKSRKEELKQLKKEEDQRHFNKQRLFLALLRHE